MPPAWTFVSPDALQVADLVDAVAVSTGSQIQFFDRDTAEERADDKIDTSAQLVLASPDRRTLAVVAGADRSVSLIDGASRDVLCCLTRMTGDIKNIAWSHDSRSVAVVGDSGAVRIIAVTEDRAAGAVTDLEGHTRDVFAVAFDPRGELLATAGSEGAVRLWHLGSATQSKVLKILPEGDTGVGMQLAWSPDGALLAVPGDAAMHTKIVILERANDWQPKTMLDYGHTKRALKAAFSPCGAFLASSGLDSKLVVWCVALGTEEIVVDLDSPVSSLQWSAPSLLVGQEDGKFCTWDTEAELAATKAKLAALAAAEADSDDDDDDAAAAAVEKAKLMKKKKKLRRVVDDDDEEEAEAEAEAEGGAAASGLVLDQAEEDDDLAFLDNVAELASGEALPESKAANDAEDAEMGEEEEAAEAEEEEPVLMTEAGVEMQLAFQPCASPPGLRRQFLAWTDVGSIVTVDEGTYSQISIEFNDTTAHKAMKLTDRYGFSLGALSETAAVMCSPAAPPIGPGASPVFATVYYTAFDGGAFTHTLPLNEDPEAVAVGQGWAAVVTSRQMVRVFGHGGLQEAPFLLPGPIVCAVGRGSLLGLVYHGAAPFNGSQSLHYKVINVDSRAELASGAVGMSPSSTLVWAGFSDTGMLLVKDSAGLLLGLAVAGGLQWTPLLDTAAVRRSPLDALWPVAVSDSQLLYVLLKGGEETPVVFPKPILVAHPLTAPLLASGGAGSGEMEVTFVNNLLNLHYARWLAEAGARTMTQDDLNGLQSTLDASTLKLVDAACKTDAPDRVGDLAGHLQLEKAHAIAIKLAGHYHHNDVAERIHQLMSLRFSGGAAAAAPGVPPPPPATLPLPSSASDQNALPSLRPAPEEEDELASPMPPMESDALLLGRRKRDEEESPEEQEGEEEPQEPAPAAPRNPFAKRTVASPNKRAKQAPKSMKDAFSAFASPQKPALGRASSFAQQARRR